MSHSPALETPSPSATTPSTPVFRNLVHGDRNHSRSPPPTYSAKDDKFLYQPENTMIRQQHHEHSRSSDHKKHSEHEHHRESSSKDRHSQKEGSVPREHHSAERTGKEIQDSRLREMDRHNKENIGQSREFHLTGVQNLEAPRLEQDLARLSHSKGSSHRLSTGLQVSLTSSNISSTPLSGTYTEVGWHSGMGQQAPHSPGAVSWSGDAAPTSSDKSSETGLGAPRLSRKESYKAQRQNYRREKKRAASALLSSLEDPAVIILADWLKIRGSLKSWTKLWCVLKPGLLLIYKSQKAKSNHWVGTVLLSACQVIERPSKKDGFCFKLYHPMEQSIWAPRGPHNEAIGAVVQPLPTAHLIFRAPSQAAGKCWLDGLEVALRCSTMLLRCGGGSNQGANETRAMDATANHETQWSPEDLEKHFNEHDLEGAEMSESESDGGAAQDLPTEAPGEQTQDTDTERRILHRLQHYYEDEPSDDVGQSGEVIEELGEENKSLLWFLIKQVRPGMDLSKVALPTFILEPRSFLDKLSDSFYHADILASAWKYEDPFDRMKAVTTWYLSGFYRKPRGLKKPYNPVLGESFRCCWLHPNSNTRTYYVAEQVSHHPPLSAFYVSNRKEGFTIEASILAKSKFYGISTSAILEGTARVSLLPLAETYLCTSPYAHCKGLLAGTLSMELGGRVTVTCPDTNYSAEIEFRLKPMLGGADSINLVSGRIRHHKETMATLDGHWDTRVEIKDRRTQETSVLLDVSELKHRRLKRQTIRAERLGEFESQKLWHKVSTAIAADDQVSATEEKTVIEEAQRERARALGGREWVPRYFRRAPCDDGNPTHSANTWQYNYPNLAPWDDSVDVLEYESDYIVQTLSRDENMQASPSHALGAHPETEHSASETDSTNSHHHRPPSQGHQSMAAALLRMEAALLEQGSQLAGVRAAVTRLENPSLPLHRPPAQPASWATPLLCLSLAFIIQTFYYWIFR